VFARRKAAQPPEDAGDQTAASAASAAPGKLPLLAIAADVLAALLALAGTLAIFSRGVGWQVGSLRLAIHSAWRPYLWATIVLLLRNWLVPHPPALAWLLKGTSLAWLFKGVRDPLPLDEQRLFEEPVAWPRRIGEIALLLLAFSALVVALTWPQARRLDSVPDLGDPLFSIWRIAWVNHQILRHPLDLFDANMFYPERLTLTYSDAVIVPALMAAPLFWAGLHPVLIYNLLVLSAFVLSGVAMFLFVRALTGRIDAAFVAGAIFTLYPYRYEHYPHLELQMTMWMPLALWAMHRTMARGRLGDGLATGVAFALQVLSSLYYGLFLALYLLTLGGALWLARGRPRRPLWMLAAGAALAAVLVAPVIAPYISNRAMVGDRGVAAVNFYSAVGSDYLKPHFRIRMYEEWRAGGHPERQLFPRFMPVILSAIALWPPLSVARIGYVLSLIVAVDGSLGFNGGLYPWLYTYVPPFRGLRVPARFSMLVGLTLSILAGYGAARMLKRWPRQRVALSIAMLSAIILEAIPRMPLEHVWREPPAIYAGMAGQPSAVLAEFPMPPNPDYYFYDTRYLYFSTFHWHPIVNGNSGYFPASYDILVQHEQDFPSDAAVAYLRARGVDYVAVHGAFYGAEGYGRIVQALDARRDMELVKAAPWEGSESRLYRLRK